MINGNTPKTYKNVIFYIKRCGKQEYYAYMKIDEAEEFLKEYKFIRTHQSFLVNPNYIKTVNKNMVELLIEDKKLPVSRAHSLDAKKKFDEFKEKE